MPLATPVAISFEHKKSTDCIAQTDTVGSRAPRPKWYKRKRRPRNGLAHSIGADAGFVVAARARGAETGRTRAALKDA